MAIYIPPVPNVPNIESREWLQWFELVRAGLNTPPYALKSGNPVAADIPAGTWGVWKNTATNTVRLWANNNGTLVGVTLT